MAPQDKAAAGPAGANGAVKKKRVVTTAADRERLKLRSEDIKWNAAKTPEAKAWINSTRLLKEFLGNGEDVLALKVAPGTRRDMWAKADAMGLHVEMFDTQARKDGPTESWIVLGRVASRMAVAGKVRDIQRQNKRQLQEAEEEAENDGEADAGADEPKNPADLIDPSLREQRAPVAQMMLPGAQQDVRQQLPAIDYTSKKTNNNKTAQTNLPNADIEAAKQLSNLRSQDVPARPVFRKDPREQETTPKMSGALPQETSTEQPVTEETTKETTEDDRIASWVSQQAQSAQTEKDIVDPTGIWKISCAAIAEQLGSSSPDLTLTIHLEPTRPQSDNDTDDESPATITDDTLPDSAELTEAQKARLGTYQLWATFDMGLYQGIIRFMSPTTVRANPTPRTSFDLLPTQLPSAENRTFQYKWRGRETSDSEISVEADNATQFIRFEEDGVKMTGVFECEYLGETGFEGQKVGKGEATKGHLGKAWSQVSPQAHEIEAQQKA